MIAKKIIAKTALIRAGNAAPVVGMIILLTTGCEDINRIDKKPKNKPIIFPYLTILNLKMILFFQYR